MNSIVASFASAATTRRQSKTEEPMDLQGIPDPQDSLFTLEEPLVDDDVLADLLTMPGIKRELFAERHDDELGLRGLLEQPESLTRSVARRKGARHRGTPDFTPAA
jgi:hypothetical protein